MAQIIMIMISTTLARRDMHRKKNLCTSPNLHGNGQLGEHMFDLAQTVRMAIKTSIIAANSSIGP